MPRTITFDQLFSIVTFRRNRTPKDSTNEWLATGLGKIGIIQQDAYLPDDVKSSLSNPNLECFSCLCRLAREFRPGEATGSVLLHPLRVIQSRRIRMVTVTAITTTLAGGPAIMALNDPELAKSLTWSVTVKTRRELMQELGVGCLIPDNSAYVKQLARSDADLAYAIERSDALLNIVETR